jgi:arginyl-tRNA synthetase
MGYKWHKDLIHVSYGLVSLEDGKMSSRHGNFILMQDLLNQAIANTKKIIIEKNPKLLDKNKVSEIVGIGAVIFNNLYNSRIKNIIFSWDKILNFEGETGPYVHYAFVRTCSILKKSNFNFEIKNKNIEIKKIYFNKLTDKYSIRIIKIIDEFKEKIIESSEKLEPHIISRHVMFLAQSFNEFYRENNILNNNDFKIKYARLFLVYCVNIILKIGLEILGIKTCEVM